MTNSKEKKRILYIPERKEFITFLHNNYLEIEKNNEDDTIHTFPRNNYKNGVEVENEIYGTIKSPPYIICKKKKTV